MDSLLGAPSTLTAAGIEVPSGLAPSLTVDRLVTVFRELVAMLNGRDCHESHN